MPKLAARSNSVEGRGRNPKPTYAKLKAIFANFIFQLKFGLEQIKYISARAATDEKISGTIANVLQKVSNNTVTKNIKM